MKIDKTGKTPAVNPLGKGRTGGLATAAGATASQSTPGQVAGTTVHLGDTASQLQSLDSSLSNTPVVDVQKVAQIKQAISSGQFRVNASAVADGLIASVQSLVLSGHH